MNDTGSQQIGGKKQLLAEEVFQHLGKAIVTGDLAPGHRIRDVDVARELHVSRMPVREALQRLERIGLVTMYPSRFTEVTEVTAELIAQTLEFAGYQAGALSRMAALRMTDDERIAAATLIDKLIASVDDAVQTSDARWAIFSYLLECANNALLGVLINESGLALFRNLHNWTIASEDRESMLAIYADYRDAILRGDPAESERLARAMHYVR